MKSKKKDIHINKNRLFFYVFLLLLIPSVLYFRVVDFEFSTLDDTNIIVTHYDILGDIKNIKEAFTHDAFMSNTGDSFYRPVQTLSFMLDAQIGGKEPWIYHLSNLILHILTVITFFFFLNKIGIKKEISFLLSLFFSIHPLFTHAVAWVPARGDLLVALFALLTFISFLEYSENRKKIYFILHSAFFLLAVFSKETAVFIPPIILFYIYFTKKQKIVLKEIVPFLAVWCFTFVLFYCMRQHVIRMKQDPNIFGIIPFIKNLPAIPITFGKFFIPYNLSTLPLFDTLAIIVGILMIMVFTLLTIKFMDGEKRIIIFGCFWFLAFFLPPMLFRSYIADIGIEYFEYRAYLPMMGILLIAGILISKIPSRYSSNQIIKMSMPVLLLYSIISFIHSTVFADPLSFFTSAVNANSKNAMALNSRGCIYSNKGEMEEAIKDFNDAIRIIPIYSNPYYNMGDTYNTLGDNSRAEDLYTNALKYDTLYPNLNVLKDNAYISLSAEKIVLNKNEEALLILNKAKKIYPNSTKIFNNIGYTYSLLGKFDSAIIGYNRAIILEPNSASYYNNRAKAKYHLKDYNGSMNDFNKALNIDPGLQDAYLNRGIMKIDMNDFEGAISDCNTVINSDPQSGEGYYYRGMAYSKINNKVKAEKDWSEAQRLGYNGMNGEK
ncbi:MAG: glycosyltransferase family 39 protein [Ignavibacteriaceae bacterium]|nr:glycosyltransferase family 39 protein [Ignavibacteriaceae bacterium]